MNKTILIVDDCRQDAERAKSLLESVGFMTETVEIGTIGYERLLHGLYAAALIDLTFPDGDTSGLDIIRSARQNGVDIPILVITGDETSETLDKMFREKIDDYVVKAKMESELVPRLRCRLARHANGGAILRWGLYTFDSIRGVLTGGTKPVELAKHYEAIFELLMRHPGRAFTLLDIVRSVWGASEDPDLASVDRTVRRLKNLLKDAGIENLIRRCKNGSYYICVDESASA